MATAWSFFARPREVAEPLTSKASLLLDFSAFHAADIPLANQKAIVEDEFGSFRRVQPDAE